MSISILKEILIQALPKKTTQHEEVTRSKVDLTYKSEEKGSLDKKTFFYRIKKMYEREKKEEKQMQWNFVGHYFTVD